MSAQVGRISDRATFVALRREGRRRRHGPVTVTWLSAPTTGPPRVAYAIGRRVGGAVVRNRVRRRLRAIARALGPGIPPGSYLLSVGPEAVQLSYEELRVHVAEAVKGCTA